jgi:phosphate transport system substrate-binding protein
MFRFVRDARCWLSALVLLAMVGPSAAADPGIRGAGATFPFPIYAKWAAEYKRQTGVDISYAPVGSGAGVDQIERKLVDFGASDVPLAAAQLQRLGLVQFPAVIGGVVPVLNITGIKSGDLKLSGQVLGDIYLGKIGQWNDRAIVELNPGLHLPNSNITVVHRSDSSGTTYLWSEFLSRSSPEWKARVGVGNELSWPTGVADAGNQGVASSVQRTKFSIGYVEYIYAKQHNLSVVAVRNREGRFVAPGKAAFAAAAMSARWQSVTDLDQMLVAQAGITSWPITGASFILLPTKPDEPRRAAEVLKFFDWALHRGKQLADDLDYVSMPDSAVEVIGSVWAEQVRAPDGSAIWPAGNVGIQGRPPPSRSEQ